MRIFTSLFLFLFGLSCTAQVPKWVFPLKAGGSQGERIIKQIPTLSGRYVLLYSQSSIISIGSQTIAGVPSGGGAFFTTLLIKLNQNNELEQVIKNTPGNLFSDFQTDEQEDVFLYFSVSQNSTFLGRTFNWDPNLSNRYLIRLGSNGQIISVKSNFPSYNFSSGIRKGIFFMYRKCCTGSQTIGNVQLNDSVPYLLKADTAGNLLAWKNLGKINTGDPNNSPIFYDGQKLYFTGGYYNNDLRFNPQVWTLPSPRPGDGSLFVATFDSNLQFVRALTTRGKPDTLIGIGSSVSPSGGITEDGRGGIWVAGQCMSRDTIQFDSLTLIDNPEPVFQQQYFNVFLVRIGPDGKALEGRIIGGNRFDEITGISCDSLHNIWLTGFSGAGFELDGIGTAGSEGGMWLLKLNNRLRAQYIKEAKGLFRGFSSVYVNQMGNASTSGVWTGNRLQGQLDSLKLDSLVFPPTPSAPGNSNQQDCFFARLGNCNLSNPTLSGPSNQSFCQGDSLTLSCSPFQKYQWSTGDSTQSISIKKPGAYHCYIYDSLGCYARSQTIVVNEIPIRTSNLSVSICFNESYLGYDTSGIYIDTLVSSLGCDSIRTLNLSIKPKITFSQNIRLCQNQTLQVGTRIYTQAGIYLDTLAAANGCDSIVTSTLNYDIPNNSIQLSAEFGALAAPDHDSYQWLDCNAGFAPIPNETDSSFAPTLAGSYAVRVTKGNCADTSGCVLVTSNNNLSKSRNEIRIYPQPVKDKLYIEMPETSQITELVLMDAMGRIVLNEKGRNMQSISVSKLPAGLYQLKVFTGKEMKVFAVMVEK